MNYFSKGITRNKLCILFFLKEMECELTKDQIISAMLENEMQFFDLQSAFIELEEEGLLAAVPRSFGQGYYITSIGENSLNLFRERIPQSQRDSISKYIGENKNALITQKQFNTLSYKLQNGKYCVLVRVTEQNSPVLELSFEVPDAQTATKVCKEWQQKAETVYKSVIDTLIVN